MVFLMLPTTAYSRCRICKIISSPRTGLVLTKRCARRQRCCGHRYSAHVVFTQKTQGIKALWAKMHEHDEDQFMGPESEPNTVKKFPSFMLTCHGFDAKFHEQLQRHDSSSTCARNPKDIYKEAHPGRDRPWQKNSANVMKDIGTTGANF